MHVTRAAVEEGIVPGGGVSLLRAAKALEAMKAEGDEQIGINIIHRACEEPVRQISGNAGLAFSPMRPSAATACCRACGVGSFSFAT